MSPDFIEGFRLSAQQKHLWLLQKHDKPYRARLAVRLRGAIDRKRLEAAVSILSKRHEILRTKFHQLAGMKIPVQTVAENVSIATHRLEIDSSEEIFSSYTELPDEENLLTQYTSPALNQMFLLEISPQETIVAFDLPALCADAETLKNIYAELVDIYVSVGNESDQNEPEAIQYIQFSEWQSEVISDEKSTFTFWDKAKNDDLWLAKLPFEKRSNDNVAFAPRHTSIELTGEIAKLVTDFCGGRKVPVPIFFLACWASILSRWTGRTSVLTGTAFDGRVSEEFKNALGLYAQCIPLVFEFPDAASVNQMLEQVERVVREMMNRQEYFSWDALDDLQTESIAARTRFIPHLFDFVELPESTKAAAVEFSVHQLNACHDRFKLKLSVIQRIESISFELHFDPVYFSDEAARRLLAQFYELAGNAAREAEKPILSLNLTGESEKRLLTTDFNQTAEIYSIDECLHQLIERQSAARPDATAVVCAAESLSYGELNARADYLANYLRFLGVTIETPVVLCLERSLDVFTGLLGILKAGGIYVPFNPAYPREQMAFMLGDSRAAVVLTHSSLLGKLPETNAQVICLDTDWSKIASESPASSVREVNPANAAYIIYTSGSTGQPKGVVVSHRNAVHSTRARFTYYQESVASYLLLSPFAFDSSVAGIFWTLAQGGTLVLPPENFQQNLSALLETIESRRISHLLAPPSLYGVLLDESAPEQLESLHTVIVAGEASTLDLLNRHRKKFGKIALFNEYGPTENTVWSTVDNLTAHENADFVSIGRPIANTQIYLLDSQMNPVPLGAAGEIYLGGWGIARGYLNRPDLTAARFVPDSFSEEPGARLYRTGDLARYGLDGRLEFLGRIDNQVKIRGFRIELEEIEIRLTQHPAVSQAAVIVHESASGENRRLIAYIAAVKDGQIDSNELRNFLARTLPEQMIPTIFLTVDSLPLTYNGKIDRRALPAPESLSPERRQTFIAPLTTAEKTLAEVWAQVLAVEQVGVTDDFFDLGGDSIRSLQVVSRAAERGIFFSVQQLIQHPNIRRLLAISQTSAPDSPPALNISTPFSLISDADRQKLSADIEDAYPLTMLQTGMLFHSELGAEAAVYHDVMSFRVRAEFNEKNLRDAVDQLSVRHPVIRTSFDFTNFSQPLQMVHRQAEIPLLIADLRDSDAAEQEIVLTAWQTTEKRRGFEWNEPPLLRFAVHRLGNEKFQLSYACHHAILDGWSAATMLTELFQVYTNRNLPAPSDAVFRDFVALEVKTLASEASRAYWSETFSEKCLTSLPGSITPPDKPAPPVQTRNVELPTGILPSLREFARTASVPLKSVLLAAHLKVLSLFAGQTEITTGLISHGREELDEGERVLGLFLNTVPFRVRLKSATWHELSRQIFAREQEIFPHRIYPLAEIQRRFNNNAALLDSGFNFIHFHVFDPLLGLDEIEYLGGDFSTRTNLALLANFILDPHSDQLSLQLEFDAARFGETSFEDLADYYRDVLGKMINEPDVRHEAYAVSPDQQRQLQEWNDTGKHYDLNNCLHHLFEEQAAQTPDAVAITSGDEHLTYRELNERSNRLAHYLIKQGSAPEQLIAVCMERSPEMFVALLAILKTGAAYVPVDSAYPPERRTFMLTDAQARLVLTHNHLADALPENDARILCVDREWSSIVQESAANPPHRTTGQNLAYMIYTSGSTGQPKGAMNTHGGIVNRLLWMQDAYPLTAEDCVLHKTPLSFDVSVWELFWALMVGARIAVARPGGHQDSGYLTELIRRERVTTAHFVPAMLRVFLGEATARECRSLKRVICSGEALAADSVERFFSLFEQTELHNLYGPTEAAVDVTARQCRPSTRGASVPIGRPIANTQIHILNRELLPVPIGVNGEIWISGVGVGRGYHRRADLTAERFIPDLFSNESGTRMYRTGDAGRFTINGEIEFLGRLDYQVKLRGFRIEPGEIEVALRQNEAVRDALVMLRGESINGHLTAYVVPFETISEIDALQQKLQDELKLNLPDYMQPSYFVWLDEMPLLPNGKINRQLLPSPNMPQPEIHSAFIAPRTAAEQFIADLLADALKIEKVGLDDDFFALGGHSLIAMEVVAKLRSYFQTEFPLTGLFEKPTVSGLLELLTNSWGEREIVEEIAATIMQVEQLSELEVKSLTAN